MKIRLSPSGPVVENSGGAPFEPGTGAMLRLSEGTTTIGGSLAIPSQGAPATIGTVLGGGTVLVETLLLPNANLNYRATLCLAVTNNQTNVGGTVDLYIDTSVDGVNWVNQVANTTPVPAGTGVDGVVAGAMHLRCDLCLRPGGSLTGGMADGSPSLRVRGRISTTTTNSALDVSSPATAGALTELIGTAYLSLSEHF